MTIEEQLLWVSDSDSQTAKDDAPLSKMSGESYRDRT
jgi:hypothetical protein